MHIHRGGSEPTVRAPESTFTGDVRISGYFRRPASSRLVGAVVIFRPGARTPWKINPLGQTLVVTAGLGWTQADGEDVVALAPGDLVWFPPGQRHWEGATSDHSFTYVALQEEDGESVQFGAAVTDEEYLTAVSTTVPAHWGFLTGSVVVGEVGPGWLW